MKVLIYSQIFPFPPQHGAHHRIRQLIRYFLSRSCEVHLLCHSCTWGNPFDRGAVDLNITAQLIRFPTWGHRADTAWKRIFGLRELSIVSKVAFNRVLRDLAPDIILMNYAHSMSLLPRRAAATVVVDTHDFLTVSRHLSIKARALLDEQKYEFVPLKSVVDEFLCNSASEVAEEVEALNKADLILAISKHEGRIFQDQTKRQVQTFNYGAEGMSVAPAPHDRLGIMPIGTGDNPHNILGAYCIDRAMRCLNPAQTVVAAVGRAAHEMPLGSWCEPMGHVDDYFDAVRRYGFGVCPAFWGTGAQIKQYEFAELAMPIVAYRWMVDLELWVDGENCLLTDDPRTFAEQLCSMASSPKLLASLREGAKLLKQRVAERLTRQERELDCRLGLRAAACLDSTERQKSRSLAPNREKLGALAARRWLIDDAN